MNADIRRRRAAREQSGLAEIEAEKDRMAEAWWASTRALVTTSATTSVGRLAFLEYLQGLAGDPDQGELPDGWERTVLATVICSANAVQS